MYLYHWFIGYKCYQSLTRQKTPTRQIGNGNEVAGVKVGKFRERVHNFASTDQMEATNSAK